MFHVAIVWYVTFHVSTWKVTHIYRVFQKELYNFESL